MCVCLNKFSDSLAFFFSFYDLALFRESRVFCRQRPYSWCSFVLCIDKGAMKLGLAFDLDYFNFVNGHNVGARKVNILSCIVYINVCWTLVWHLNSTLRLVSTSFCFIVFLGNIKFERRGICLRVIFWAKPTTWISLIVQRSNLFGPCPHLNLCHPLGLSH